MNRSVSRRLASAHRPRRDRSRRLFLEQLERRNLLATVVTDLDDYMPGDTAQITANGFDLGATVEFHIVHDPLTPGLPDGEGHDPWSVEDGSSDDLDGLINGTILTTWYVNPDDSLNSIFHLTATGPSGGLSTTATTTFTDDTPLPTELIWSYDAVTDTLVVHVYWDSPFSNSSSTLGAAIFADIDGNGIMPSPQSFVRAIDGLLDINNDGSITGADDGTVFGVTVTNGFVNPNGGATGETSDDVSDNRFGGYNVFDGRVDLNLDNAGNTADDGRLADYAEALNAIYLIGGLVDVNRNGVIDAGDDAPLVFGYNIVDGYVDEDGDGTPAESGDDLGGGQFGGFNVSDGVIQGASDGALPSIPVRLPYGITSLNTIGQPGYFTVHPTKAYLASWS